MSANDLREDDLAAWLNAGYDLQVDAVCRIAAGTATDNFLVEHTGGTVMVKMYRPGVGLEHERRVLAVTDNAAQSGLPVAQLLRSTTGALLHTCDGLTGSVWQWCDSDSPPGPLTVDVAYETGSALARLHTFLRQYDDGSWPVAQPHYRRHALNHIQQRFAMLARRIDTLPQPTGLDTLNLERIRQRLTQLRHAPGLLESATPPQNALVHGDYVRPNLLIHNGRLRAVIDMRLKYDEPVRELGRLAFDVQTIAAGRNWIEVAQAALTEYLAEGGIIATTALHGCARLALLHSLCSTYPVEVFTSTRHPRISEQISKRIGPTGSPRSTRCSRTSTTSTPWSPVWPGCPACPGSNRLPRLRIRGCCCRWRPLRGRTCGI